MKFNAVSHSWVALHPQPKGVVQFIGGAFVGTFGTSIFYQHLLKFIYDQQYTIIILPFKFTFNHYQEAGFLITEQYEILPELVRSALLEGYDHEAYLDNRNFFWLGHSIGCKYIALLEGFSALPDTPEERALFINKILSNTKKPRNKNEINKVIFEIESLIKYLQERVTFAKKSIKNQIAQEIILGDSISTLFIKGQVSVLLAPNNSDTKTALQFEFLANLLDRLRLGVSPTPEETNSLIIESNLFNKLGLVAFDSDTTAKTTVNDFLTLFQKPPAEYQVHKPGGHFRPIGTDFFNQVLNIWDIPYGWLRYLTRMDSQKPTSLTPWLESSAARNSELEVHIINLYRRLH
ncbi:MAG: DUF1350 family protein [Nostocales cyanobacterium LE14-WE4]|jgi:hypothetical protein|uniref:DUF1350 family protein n=1 Tax=Anabaena sp. AL09 TaxID=1710891 RepID=UPI000801C68F|nr:DUF1350 family protein [Anabaena sp. AL09]MCE2699842.1 DUF1350 family protein [Anabaena sp. 49633_E8]MDJ0499815.1 DUF1350 family protein [Nostocales cyanobacterium LE14-WE4]OBQ13214.1 MAG: hypothetical protein AN490_03180 [Anabaena sp. AL09]